MRELVIQPTSLAQWYDLVNEAEVDCSLQLSEELESYLVFLLMRFVGQPQMVMNILAVDFLKGIHTSGKLRQKMLQEVGDKCLLIAGLFPESAKRRQLSESYYIHLGQNAYYALTHSCGESTAHLYAHLCTHFEPLRDVMHAMRPQDHALRVKLQTCTQHIDLHIRH